MASETNWQTLIEKWLHSGLMQAVSSQKAPLSLLPVTVMPSSDHAPQVIMFKHATKSHQLKLPSSVSRN